MDEPQMPAHIESIELLQAVLEALPVFVVLLDDDDRIRYINHLQPGFEHSQVIGHLTYEFVAAEYREMQRQTIAAARSSGGSHSFMIQGDGGEGRVAFYESRAIGVDDPQGHRQVYIVALEVTEHVARAKALRESEENLRLAVDATGIGLWSWDLQSNQVEWSPRMREIAGVSRDLDPASYVRDCVHPDDKELMRSEAASATDGNAQYPIHRIVRPDGEIRWVAPTGSIIRNAQGEPIRMHGGTLDVTTQRQSEERLRQVQKLDAIGSLTAGVAHNFNNMMAVIVPAIESVLHEVGASLPVKSRHLLEEASGAAHRAADLVAQLMVFAGQRRSTERTTVDIVALLEQVVSMCRQTFDRQVVVQLAVKSRPLFVSGDAAALEQVFLNLIINARDAVLAARSATPRIEVEVAPADDPISDVMSSAEQRLRITIRDNGGGMSDEVKRRLFEPFFTTKPHGQGTGLGLATSRATVGDHGGTITITSQLEFGTCCEILLPRAQQASLAPPKRSEPPAVRPSRVLVVDDEPAIRDVLRYLLEQQGHHIEDADSGTAALTLVDRGFRPDLVLLDRSMPGLPAQEIIERLRAILGSIPILFFTGQAVSDQEAALVQEVLAKPLTASAISDSVSRWLHSKA